MVMLLIPALLWFGVALANIGLHAGDDLHRFVTRPDLASPRYNVTKLDKDKVAPGYWFLATQHRGDNNIQDVKWMSCQVGPMIYDNNGDLVWSGACDFNNRIQFDFEPTEYGGEKVLKSLIKIDDDGPRAIGFFLNDEYDVVRHWRVDEDDEEVNLHEFNVFPEQNRTLVATRGVTRWTGEDVGEDHVWIAENGVREYDTYYGNVTFAWKAQEHVGLDESTFKPMPGWSLASYDRWTTWDPFHMNAVDKNEDGDFLMGFRHMDAVLLVSHVDGHVIWRLGGPKSDYHIEEGLVFSRMHHARFVSHTPEKDVVSFLDNAAGALYVDQSEPTNNCSRGLFIELDRTDPTHWTAKLLREYSRPDGGFSRQRGNVQTLENGNVMVVWTDAGYFSEFTQEGEHVMDARFYLAPGEEEERLNVYRLYKSTDWVGRPTNPPDVRAFRYGISQGEGLFAGIDSTEPRAHDNDDDEGASGVTVVYVSWNGATEHTHWKFYSSPDGEVLGPKVKRTGFETVFVTTKNPTMLKAQALDKDGTPLGESRDILVSYENSDAPPPPKGLNATELFDEYAVPGWEELEEQRVDPYYEQFMGDQADTSYQAWAEDWAPHDLHDDGSSSADDGDGGSGRKIPVWVFVVPLIGLPAILGWFVILKYLWRHIYDFYSEWNEGRSSTAGAPSRSAYDAVAVEERERLAEKADEDDDDDL